MAEYCCWKQYRKYAIEVKSVASIEYIILLHWLSFPINRWMTEHNWNGDESSTSCDYGTVVQYFYHFVVLLSLSNVNASDQYLHKKEWFIRIWYQTTYRIKSLCLFWSLLYLKFLIIYTFFHAFPSHAK